MAAPATRRSTAWSSSSTTAPTTCRMRPSISTASTRTRAATSRSETPAFRASISSFSPVEHPAERRRRGRAFCAGNATDFPAGTAVTTANLLDAVVYDTDDADDPGLLALLNAGQPQVNENGGGSGDTQSIQRCPNGTGGARNTSTYLQGAPTPGGANTCPPPPPPVNSTVVISQLYGGGGNAGATYHNDYVELYNRSAATVDLSGWSLQYASATGSGWDANRQPLGGAIGPGEYYLVSLASGGSDGASLPPANINGQINMSGTSGKIALVNSFDGLVGNCPNGRSARDGLRRLWQRGLPGRGGDSACAGQYHVDIPRRQWQHRHQQQRQRLRHRCAGAQADGADRRDRAAGAGHRSTHQRQQRAARRHHPGDVHRAGRRGRRLVRHHLRRERTAQQRDDRRRRPGPLHHAEHQLRGRRAVHGHHVQGPGDGSGSGRRRAEHRYAAGELRLVLHGRDWHRACRSRRASI